MARAQRVGARVHHGGVLALTAAARARAVVVRRQAVALLHHLLQPALVVLVLDRLGERLEAAQVEVVGGVVPRVQEDRSQDGLEGVGEKRLEVAPAAAGDALSQEQEVAQVQALGKGGQGVRVHHGRPDLRHLPLLGARPPLEEVFGRDQLEHRVTQVLEALVVARRDLGALVGER